MAVPDNDVILALDVGTGGARAVAYTLDGQLVAESAADYPTYYDHPTWSEQDPDSWWNGALSALEAVGRQLADSGYHIRAIGLTGQSPTIAPFDAQGRPLRRGMLYQDNRATTETAEWVEELGGHEAIHQRTGHDPAAFHIGPKVLWVRRHEPAIFTRTATWLQPRDMVAMYLTGARVTDWSHAGSTLLFDIRARVWASDFFAVLDLPVATFPPAVAPWTIIGNVLPQIAERIGVPGDVAVVIGGADSQCCAVGAGALAPSQLSDMAGTSTCLNASVRQPVADLRVSNYCHVVPDWWCTELGLNASGAAFAWIARLFAGPGAEPDFASSEAAAAAVRPGAEGLLFLPYLADGERFDPSLRGAFCGLSLRHGRGELARAVLEGVAFAIREHLDIMAQAGAPISEIRVSGGGARSPLWNQIKADITGVPVLAVASDATSLGVALIVATALGHYSSLNEAAKRCVRISRRYEPDSSLRQYYDERYSRFRELTRATAETRGQTL
jgi:sugar (pentulose or hexulose) kinase